jgi:hypothetical protein
MVFNSSYNLHALVVKFPERSQTNKIRLRNTSLPRAEIEYMFTLLLYAFYPLSHFPRVPNRDFPAMIFATPVSAPPYQRESQIKPLIVRYPHLVKESWIPALAR